MKHYFPSNRMTVETHQLIPWKFMAFDADEPDLDLGCPIGWGSTELEAIADLYKKLRESGELED